MAEAGAGVDASGNPVLDPTKNVLDLVDAAINRQDDLRELTAAHVKEIVALRAEYDKELREAETNRIDAIRQVDVGNVQRAAEVQAAQALTLATQVTTSAEALRAQVATTATAFDAKLTLALEPIQKRIDDLTRAQYETVGQKTQVVEARSSIAGIYAFASVAIGVIGLIIAAFVATH
jgi:hypothetical protein